MQQATGPFWIGKEDGTGDEFVPKGKMFPDNHPLVARAKALFEPVEVAEVPAEMPKEKGKGR